MAVGMVEKQSRTDFNSQDESSDIDYKFIPDELKPKWDDKCDWRDLQSYSFKPTIEMTVGITQRVKGLVKGEPRGTGGRWMDVRFDTSYIEYWILKFIDAFYHSHSFRPFKTLSRIFLTVLLEYCKEDLKVYTLHGHKVVRLEDLGLEHLQEKKDE
jgi:hypothetical protein